MLSIIIVSYNCYDYLRSCLLSLQGANDVEVIVVDNASGDDTIERMGREFPTVSLVKNPVNVGFPAANNQGLRIAAGNLFLLLNPDTIVDGHALISLVEFLNSEPVFKIVGLNVRNPDGSQQASFSVQGVGALAFIVSQLPLRGWWTRIFPNRISADHSEPFRVSSVSGCALAFSEPTLQRVGLLDEAMFWAEDLDYCFRAAKLGIPVFVLPSARVKHFVGQSGKTNWRRMIRAQHESRIVYSAKHFGFCPTVLLRFLFLVLLPVKIFARLIQACGRKRRTEMIERVKGYVDSFAFTLGSGTR